MVGQRRIPEEPMVRPFLGRVFILNAHYVHIVVQSIVLNLGLSSSYNIDAVFYIQTNRMTVYR